jgi:hypothetical protein
MRQQGRRESPSPLRCSQDASLSEAEKAGFAESLDRQGLRPSLWDLFGEWVARSTSSVRFFYLKVHSGSELVGLGLLVRVRPFDLRTSYAPLRRDPFWSKLAGGLSTLSNHCVYLSFRNLITSNLSRTLFSRTPELEDEVLVAILRALKELDDADMVSIVDTRVQDDVYAQEGFTRYPSPSEAYLDVGRYGDLSEYLAQHPSLRRNLARRSQQVQTEIVLGPASTSDREQMSACVACSAGLSRVNTPCQQFFEHHLLDTEVFSSDKYLHIRVRVDGRIAGFHIFQVCGTHLGGVLGGFNRDHTRNNFVYERVIVASLDHAIKQGLTHVHYSLVDNRTKLRLVESLEPCGLYFFARSRLNRAVFDLTYPYSDMYALFRLETETDPGPGPPAGGKRRGRS